MGDSWSVQVELPKAGDRVVLGKVQSEERSDEVAASPEPRGARGV